MPMPIRILLIEDNADDLLLIQEILMAERTARFEISWVGCLDEGLTSLSKGKVDLVLLDLSLPDSEGLETLERVRAQAKKIPVVVLTASDDELLAVQALQRGAQDYVIKGYLQVYRGFLARAIRYAIERKRAEEELRGAKARIEHLLSSITSILIGISPDGRIILWNSVAETTFGVAAAEILGKKLAACGLSWDFTQVQQGIAESLHGSPVRVDDVTFTPPGGGEGYLGLTIIPIGLEVEGAGGTLIFGADVTARKLAEREQVRLQEQLYQAQRMESIGRFAGGIAHDFHNYLQVILGFAWLLRSRYRKDRQLISDLQEIVHAAESASGMVRQMLAFSRRQPLQPKVFELNEALSGMRRLLQQFVGERIRLEMRLSPDPAFVRLDPTGLEQMVMNLCSNARDAMPEGGRLHIETSRVEVDEAFIETRSWATKGDYLRIAVQDTGSGMDSEVAAHIFEPFFSTKQIGRGTGLGLAVVYGLVKQHEGFIDIKTSPGQGTTFYLYFPRQEGSPEVEAKPAGRRQAGRVLVIERDERIRGFAEEILRESGYQVDVPAAGTDTWTFLQQHAKEIDVVIIEAAQGGGDDALLKRVRVIQPQARVLLLCTYLDDALRALEASQPGVGVLQKPFVPDQLLDGIHRLLEGSPPHHAS